jgi:hypothetical protein
MTFSFAPALNNNFQIFFVIHVSSWLERVRIHWRGTHKEQTTRRQRQDFMRHKHFLIGSNGVFLTPCFRHCFWFLDFFDERGSLVPSKKNKKNETRIFFFIYLSSIFQPYKKSLRLSHNLACKKKTFCLTKESIHLLLSYQHEVCYHPLPYRFG